MEISTNRLDRIITNVKGSLIEFNAVDLNQILGIENAGHKIVNMKMFTILILMITNFQCFLLKCWSYSLINKSHIIIPIMFMKDV